VAWKNEETLIVATWIGAEAEEDFLGEAEEGATKTELVDLLKEYMQNGLDAATGPRSKLAEVFVQLIEDDLKKVDWDAIAQSYLDQVQEEG